jgi:transcriptional regulator GlxA family with amidase domain
MARSDIVRVAVVVYPGCSSWISAGILELFAIASAVAHNQGIRPALGCEAVSTNGSIVRASQGVRVASSVPHGRYDALIVPPLWAGGRKEFETKIAGLRKLGAFLKAMARKSRILASACSGGALLAEAGLLDGHRATTCWWLTDWFAERYPAVHLDTRQLVVVDGQRWTAGAGTAYMHLCLELLKELHGAQVSDATGRLALLEPRRGSQSPFMGGSLTTNEDPLANEASELIERKLASPMTIASLARRLGVTERTLNRRLRGSFGMSPLSYLQSRRIAFAKRLLEDERVSFEVIVTRCGYSDASSFRKLFSREVGMTPREYRLRFAR